MADGVLGQSDREDVSLTYFVLSREKIGLGLPGFLSFGGKIVPWTEETS